MLTTILGASGCQHNWVVGILGNTFWVVYEEFNKLNGMVSDWCLQQGMLACSCLLFSVNSHSAVDGRLGEAKQRPCASWLILMLHMLVTSPRTCGCCNIEEVNKANGWEVAVHVDAASGGFIAPFLYPDLEWDFRLPNVKSINVSGHK